MAVYLLWLGVAAFNAADAESARKAEAWNNSPRNPINVCIARGGVPFVSGWDGTLDRCEVLPRG